jgi:hypothetical protein
MISRVDQQIRVNKLMIDYMVAHPEIRGHKRLWQYMRNYLEIIQAVSSILLIRSGTEENLAKKVELWDYLKAKDKRLYCSIRRGALGIFLHLPGKPGRSFCVWFYHICQKVFKFN